MITYFSIKFGKSFGVEKENVSDLKFRNFDEFSSVPMRKRDDSFKRKWQAEALISCTVLSRYDITNALVCQFSTGLNFKIRGN